MTFKSCPHLDGKHSVFGKIIQGLEFLDRVEGMAIDQKDVPKEDIIIEDTIVIVNPYRDSIADLLMKEWKLKHQEQAAQVKWGLGSKGGLLSIHAKDKKSSESKHTVDSIGKFM